LFGSCCLYYGKLPEVIGRKKMFYQLFENSLKGERMIKFVIGAFRVIYTLIGLGLLLFAFGYLFCCLMGYTIKPFLFVLLGISGMFFWIQSMLKQRKAFIIPIILIINTAIIIYMLVDTFKFGHTTNSLFAFNDVRTYATLGNIVAQISLLLFSYWFFTNSEVKEQFK